MQMNVETKDELLSRLSLDEEIDVILTQEMHAASRSNILEAYVIAGSVRCRQYGITTYVNKGLTWSVDVASDKDDVRIITITVQTQHV